MKMRKLMAAVLAVVIAISAMAVTVFADDAEVVKIPLYADHTDYSTNRVETFTFTLPIYNLYGYANQDSYIEFNLPKALTTDASRTEEIRYYMEVNGNRYQMKTVPGPGDGATAATAGYDKQYVNFGAFAHPYYDDNSWTTIPQTVNFNEITSLSLIAEVVIKNPQSWEGSVTLNTWDFRNDNTQVNQMYAQLWTAGANGIKEYGKNGDDQLVTGSIMYCYTMGISKTEGSYSSSYNKFSFLYNYPAGVGQSYTALDTTIPQTTTDNTQNPPVVKNNWEENILTWDHTLQNKMYALNAVSAKIVIELASHNTWETAGRTNGTAFYMLGTIDALVDHDMLGNSSLWWQYSQRDDKWISTCIVNNENVTQLTFDVPVDRLYNAMYGSGTASIFNGGFKVFAQYEAPAASFVDAYNRGYSHLALNAYLELTLPAEEETPDVVIRDPIQAGDSDEETDGADDVTVTEPEDEDTNPSTGIVLAVLPMVAAAAAIVASKRR